MIERNATLCRMPVATQKRPKRQKATQPIRVYPTSKRMAKRIAARHRGWNASIAIDEALSFFERAEHPQTKQTRFEGPPADSFAGEKEGE